VEAKNNKKKAETSKRVTKNLRKAMIRRHTRARIFNRLLRCGVCLAVFAAAFLGLPPLVWHLQLALPIRLIVLLPFGIGIILFLRYCQSVIYRNTQKREKIIMGMLSLVLGVAFFIIGAIEAGGRDKPMPWIPLTLALFFLFVGIAGFKPKD
jgi:hypothetical protein